jgi:acetylornithine deacetylase/succinyl-diaminopimelate desuccinylase-like protein
MNAPAATAADIADTLVRNARVKQSLERIKADDALTLREQIELAEIPSPPFKETARAQDFLRRMQAAGLKEAYIDEEGNVIGLRKGTGKGPLLVLSAHLDTVFPEGTDVKVQQRDGRYYGRGLTDDSRGLAAVLAVLRGMESSGIRTVGDVMFVGTVGEEGLGDLRGVKALFRDHANIDGFISVDSAGAEGGGGHRIVPNATGSHRWEISFAGPGGHSFGAFGAPSAIQAMGRAIAHISDVRPPADPKTTFTVGVVAGGTSVNTIASDAKMLVDIRSNSAQSLAETEKLVMAAIEKGAAEENARWSSSGIRFDAKLLGDRPAGMSPPDSPVTQAALQAWKALRLPVPGIETASTDSNVAINLGVPAATLSGGGEGGGAHGPDEWYKPVDAWQGPQTLLLTTVALVGVEKVTSPRLPMRSRQGNGASRN